MRQTRYANVYLFGAVCPSTGDSHGLILPHANTWAMQLFLDSLSRHIAAPRRVVLVLDQAGWHTSRQLKMPANISLLPLPPYSPELNPIENLWGYLKRRHLSNRLFDDEAELLEAGEQAWRALNAQTIRSVCHRQWLEYT